MLIQHDRFSYPLLAFPGGKSRAINQILPLIPTGVRKICSPFLGGGSIELACARSKISVYAYDFFGPLVDFWQCALCKPQKLAAKATRYLSSDKSVFYSVRNNIDKITKKIDKAATYFFLNRSAFSGVICSGWAPNNPRFTAKIIDKLKKFRVDNFFVGCADFKTSLQAHCRDFLYLDPPYVGTEYLYALRKRKTEFDHAGLANILSNRDGWILSYNDCFFIRNLYRKNRILSLNWYSSLQSGHKTSKTKEIVILSNDISLSEYNNRQMEINYGNVE